MKKICLFACALLGLMACNGMTVSANNSAYRSLKDTPPLQTEPHPTLTTTDGRVHNITMNNNSFAQALCAWDGLNLPYMSWNLPTLPTTEEEEDLKNLSSNEIIGVTFITDGSDNSLKWIGRGFLDWASNYESELVLPDSVLYIDDYFFSNIKGFNHNLSLPQNIIRIDSAGFMRNCDYMTSTLDLGSLSANVFSKSKGTTLSAIHKSAPMYARGITISGTDAEAFRAEFINLTGPSNYRNLK